VSISKASIDAVKDKIEITEVIGDFVSLKRRGQNMWACCPFHNEKSPSFSVSPAKQFFKCFGCGKAGDAITFIEEIEGVGYLDAIKYLAAKYGVEIEEREETPEEQAAQNERESLLIVLQFAKELYKDYMLHAEQGKAVGLSYFKERGFSDETIDKFELGYSPESWDYLLSKAKEKQYNLEILEKAGLILSNDQRSYDRFRDRVIFPIHNTTGKVVGFGGRILSKDAKQAKYINSPESPVYHKSKILYGLYQSRQAIRNLDLCYLVEGYTDVISMHQSGVQNVVASSGTSLTEEQIKLIGRYTKNITVLFDGDAAGLKAALRGIDMLLEEDMNVRVVVFPEGEDPDSFAKKTGSTAFAAYLKEKSRDFITFKAQLAVDEAGGDPIKKADAIKSIVGSIAKVPDPIKRNIFIKECSNLMDMDEQTLFAELNKIAIQRSRQQRPKETTEPEVLPTSPETPGPAPQPLEKLSIEDILKLQEREALRLLVNYGHVQNEDGDYLAEIILEALGDTELHAETFKNCLDLYQNQVKQGKVPEVDWFLQNTQGEVYHFVIELITKKYEPSENWFKKHEIHVPNEADQLDEVVLRNLYRHRFWLMSKLIKQKMEELKEAREDADILLLQKEIMDLKAGSSRLAAQLGIVVSR
jgi:DNA primase